MTFGSLYRAVAKRSLAELRERGAQALAARLERVGLAGTAAADEAQLWRQLRGEVRKQYRDFQEWWVERWSTRQGGFVRGAEDWSCVAQLLDRLEPGARADIVATAREIIAGRFDLLGYRRLNLGFPPDWHLEPVSGKRAAPKHWSSIDYLDPEVVGDHKVIWELNRHQWLVTLGQAYWLTRDEHFASKAVEALESWLDANPPKLGVSWASSLEIAYRSIAWLWLLRLLRGSPALSCALEGRVLAFLLLAGQHTRRYLSTYFSPNTHLTGEALGLYYLGHELADFAPAAEWCRVGRTILVAQLHKHVRPDGTYVEQSTWYHRYTLEIYSHFLVLAEGNGDSLEGRLQEVRDAVERLGLFLLAISRPDGSYPLVGDDDGGRLLFLSLRRGFDARPVLATAAALTGRSDLAFYCQGASGEAAWLLGKRGAESLERVNNRPPSFTSHAFSDGGFYVMRSDWTARANIMLVDAGPHGFLNGGHAHADALSFDLTVGGVPVLVDPGTAQYTLNREVRDRFRSTSAHNAVTVNGESSSEMAGPFAWKRAARTRVRCWHSSAQADYLEAEHDGYLAGEARASLRRCIFYVKPDIWVIHDIVTAAAPTKVALHFQCNAGLVPSVQGAGIWVERECQRLLHIGLVASESGSLTVEAAQVSPEYGVVRGATAIRYAFDQVSGVAVWTVMVAARDSGAAPALRLLESDLLEMKWSGELTEYIGSSRQGVRLWNLGSAQVGAEAIAWRQRGEKVETLLVVPTRGVS
jgi:hypothetical protein